MLITRQQNALARRQGRRPLCPPFVYDWRTTADDDDAVEHFAHARAAHEKQGQCSREHASLTRTLGRFYDCFFCSTLHTQTHSYVRTHSTCTCAPIRCVRPSGHASSADPALAKNRGHGPPPTQLASGAKCVRRSRSMHARVRGGKHKRSAMRARMAQLCVRARAHGGCVEIVCESFVRASSSS